MDGGEERYRIGELARLTGLTPRTLRYYEELELIRSERTSGGQRLYSEGSRKRLHIIESLKAAGFKLGEIRRLLLDWKQSSAGAEAAEKVLAILQAKHEQIERTVAVLQALQEQLRVSIEILADCAECARRPDLCSTCDTPQEGGRDNPLIDEILKS